jgi:formylglycine-generating enzyme required for sulfatase activity
VYSVRLAALAKIRLRLTRINYTVAGAIAALASVAIIVSFADGERSEPARCPPGLKAEGPRCCGVGQGVTGEGQCTGIAETCAADMTRDSTGSCTTIAQRIHFPGGAMQLGSPDWEGTQGAREIRVGAFDLDNIEVTIMRFRDCSKAGACPQIPDVAESGRPVRNVSPEEASHFCVFAGGHLPTSDEWLFAAAGASSRKFPWGNTGLVCRRATFGLVKGPCAKQSNAGPDFAGARPDGATAEGALDLSGNLAEWTVESDGSYRARGGSYRSELAAELVTWAEETRSTRAPHVGFRCAYAPHDGPT